MMLQAVMKSNPGSDYIYVVDTRPKVSGCFHSPVLLIQQPAVAHRVVVVARLNLNFPAVARAAALFTLLDCASQLAGAQIPLPPSPSWCP